MGIGMRELVVILLVVLVIFGAKKLRTIGSDLGHAVKGFKDAMKDGENEDSKQPPRQLRNEADAEFAETQKPGEPKSESAQKSNDRAA
jgi:sec-independent protein translocase protein TatA